jgi:DHA1 family tetracycline resistance protein-like MFS transporter
VSKRPSDRQALIFILITVALDAMGIGLLIPVIPRLILLLSGQGLVYAAIYGGWLTATFATVQFLAGPILGSLSDRFGRRPVLLVSLAAFGLSYCLMAFAPSLRWLFVAQAITGLFGATPATAGAYIADISQAGERTQRFGYMAGAFGTGLILGPALGGLLVGYGLRVPFLAAAVLSLATVVYGAWVLPESLPVASRRPLSVARANPIGAMLELNRVGGVALLLAAVFFQRVAASTIPATWPYFTMQEYGWTPQMVGYSLAAYGVSAVIMQAGLLRWIAELLGTSGAAVLALAMLVIGFVGFAFGRGPWIVATCVPLTAMGFMAGPALTSLLSADIASDSQGTLQGVLASINGVAAVLTPLGMPWLFSVFSTAATGVRFPGAPYLVAAALASVGLALVRRAKAKRPDGLVARNSAA